MSSRTAEFASAILIGVLVGVFVGAYLIIMPYGTAEDCLTEPKGEAQQGQHWFYRIDRSTKRHCWYLKAQGGKIARAEAVEPSAPAKTVSKNADKRNTETDAAPRSISNAHAELRSRARIEDDTSAASPARAAVAADASADSANIGAGITSRWPQPSGVESSAAAEPAESQTMVVADNSQSRPVPEAGQQATAAAATASDTATPDAAAPPPGKYSGSLQELVVVAFAALALAGLTGSAVYRLGRMRFARRYDASRRSADWQPSRTKARRARAASARRSAATRTAPPAPVSERAPQPNRARQPNFVPEPDFAQEPDFAPEPAPLSDYAPRPHVAPQAYQPRANVAVLSEYAPKPRTNVRTTRELEDSFESIEELLIQLAK